MTASALQAALECRHDGPLPRNSAVSEDYQKAWHVQCASRRQLAWQAVRRTSHATLAARRSFHARPSVEAYRLWRVRRHVLTRALKGWIYFRDLDRRQ